MIYQGLNFFYPFHFSVRYLIQDHYQPFVESADDSSQSSQFYKHPFSKATTSAKFNQAKPYFSFLIHRLGSIRIFA